MKQYDRATPEATRDLLFSECEMLRGVRERLSALFRESGYGEVMTPPLEYYAVFDSFYGQIAPERMLKITDGANRLICMRPDCTVPIARLVASKLSSHQPPFLLFYDQQIFSAPKEHAGKSAECWQVGVERIGEAAQTGALPGAPSGAGDLPGEGDLAILRLASKSLSAFGNFSLDIGEIGFFRALLLELSAPEPVKVAVRAAVMQKNEPELCRLLAPFWKQEAARVLSQLPFLAGGGSVIERALALTKNPKAAAALTGLSQLLTALRADGLTGVTVDLGLVSQSEYYTGLLFHGFIDGVGEPVLSGGRYDQMLAQFGRDLPAVGFGVNASLIAKSQLQKSQNKEDGSGWVTLALTKGRLEKETVKLLERVGLDCSVLADKGRKLIFELPGGIRVILAKAADVVTYVENGVADMGVVGKDTLMEMGGGFYEMLDLRFGSCRFALAGKDHGAVFQGYNTKMIATKYPKVALSYFEALGMDVEIIKIEGSVELAPLIGLADAIVDIVETGDTLRENGLSVLEEIAPVSARLIVNTAAYKRKAAPIGALLQKIRSGIES